MTSIVSSIDRTTKDSYTDLGLSTSFAQIIVAKGDNYDENQMRELPALLFEFYVEENSENIYLEKMNKVWTVDNNQPLQIVRMPTDAKIRIVPLFDEDYISRLENPDDTFDLAVYVDTNIVY